MHHPRLSVVNMVVTADLRQPVDLLKLAGANAFLYDQAIYSCAYFKDEQTKAKVSVFSSGKMICIGARHFSWAKQDLRQAARRLAELGLIKPTRLKLKLQNIVATGDLGHNLDLESLATRLPDVIYEPEQFPALIHHPSELHGTCMLIFASGKVVFAGLRTSESLRKAEIILQQIASL